MNTTTETVLEKLASVPWESRVDLRDSRAWVSAYQAMIRPDLESVVCTIIHEIQLDIESGLEKP